jgi:beta-barrel assembly-enhancing protease
VLGHRARLDAANVKRGIGRSFGKSRKAILATEIEADRLSIWLLANAGYDPALALEFWQRYRKGRPGLLISDGTHPGWQHRIAIMTAEAEAVAATPARDGKRQPPLLAQ